MTSAAQAPDAGGGVHAQPRLLSRLEDLAVRQSTKRFPVPVLHASTMLDGAPQRATLHREVLGASDPERARAKRELARAQVVLQGLRARLQQVIDEDAGVTEEVRSLVADIVRIRRHVEALAEVIDRGSSRQTAMASIGGALAVGAVIPAPEEVVTWPLGGIAALGVLIFTAAVASSDEVRDATDELVDAVTDALTRTRRRSGCRVRALGYHRGGDPIHDACADAAPPNAFPGSDVEVTAPRLGTKSYDALSPRRELWEVKTERYSSYAPFIKQQTIAANLADIATELPIATTCGYSYVFAVSDSEQFADLGARVPPGVNLRLVSC